MDCSYGRRGNGKSYNHIAFKIDESDYEMYLKRIENLGLEIKAGRKRVIGEGNSIYFYDYDNHLFELHTGTLETRLLRYQKEPTDLNLIVTNQKYC